MQCGEKRYNNKGVYAVLKPPDFESPSFHSFKDVERLQVWVRPSFNIYQFSLFCEIEKEGEEINNVEH